MSDIEKFVAGLLMVIVFFIITSITLLVRIYAG